MSRTACTEPQCLYRASVHVQSLSVCTEPQCLYRASVSVQSLSACTELQCLYRASVSVQSLSVCTMVHFTLPYTIWDFMTWAQKNLPFTFSTALRVTKKNTWTGQKYSVESRNLQSERLTFQTHSVTSQFSLIMVT